MLINRLRFPYLIVIATSMLSVSISCLICDPVFSQSEDKEVLEGRVEANSSSDSKNTLLKPGVSVSTSNQTTPNTKQAEQKPFHLNATTKQITESSDTKSQENIIKTKVQVSDQNENKNEQEPNPPLKSITPSIPINSPINASVNEPIKPSVPIKQGKSANGSGTSSEGGEAAKDGEEGYTLLKPKVGITNTSTAKNATSSSSITSTNNSTPRDTNKGFTQAQNKANFSQQNNLQNGQQSKLLTPKTKVGENANVNNNSNSSNQTAENDQLFSSTSSNSSTIQPGDNTSFISLKGKVEHSAKLSPVPNFLRTGIKLDLENFPKLIAHTSWYRIPNWFAGQFKTEKSTCYYAKNLATNQDIALNEIRTAKSTETIGFQIDADGGIWEYQYDKYIQQVVGDDYITVQYVQEHEPLEVNNQKVVMRYKAIDVKVDKFSKDILETIQTESIQTYTAESKDIIKCQSSIKAFDQDGNPDFINKTVSAKLRIKPFQCIDSYADKDLKADFITYLEARKLYDLIPGGHNQVELKANPISLTTKSKKK